jgi:hypothetical protein
MKDERNFEWTVFLLLVAAVAMSLLFGYFAEKVHAATNATPVQFELNAQVNYGLSYLGNATVFTYAEPNQSTALFSTSQTVLIPANSTNNTVNLATLFPNVNNPLVFVLTDISNPGQEMNIGMASGGSRFDMNPNGFFMFRVSQSTGSCPTLYIDNPSSNMSAFLQVTCLAN